MNYLDIPDSSRKDQLVVIDGPLDRKHDLEAGGCKAKVRSWISLYAVIRGTKMYVYLDEKSSQAELAETFHRERHMELLGGDVVRVHHHTRKHAFRLSLAGGASYLFDARSDGECNIWVETILGVGGDSSP